MKPRLHLGHIAFELSAERDQRGAITLPLASIDDDVDIDIGIDVDVGAHMPVSRLQRITGTVRVHSKDNHPIPTTGTCVCMRVYICAYICAFIFLSHSHYIH